MRSPRVHGLAVVFLALPFLALAQSGPGINNPNMANFMVVDNCGGQSTFLGSTAIVEASAGSCNVAPGMIQYASPTWTVNLSVTSSLAGSAIGDQIYFVGGMPSPSCLGAPAGFTVATVSATKVTFASTSCTATSPVANGATLSVNYVKGSGNRYELKLLQQVSSSWSVPPTITLLSNTAARTYIGAGGACSFGNPGGYFDGTYYYLAFLVQNSGSCSAANSPGGGAQYDLWACYLGSSATTALDGNPTGGNCTKVVAANPAGAGIGAILDPHIFGSGSPNLYASERDNSGVYASYGYNVWSIDQLTVSWTSTPPTFSAPTRFVPVTPTDWNTGRARGTPGAGCEIFLKLTGLFVLPGTSTVRGFFQENNINDGGSSPFVGVHDSATPTTCDTDGAGEVSGIAPAFFSGLFYADLTLTGGSSPTYYAGQNNKQFYPNPALTTGSTSCLTPKTKVNTTTYPAGGIACYGEFPWMLHDGTKMLFIGNPVTSAAVINICVSLTNCHENYTSELMQAFVSTDYSQSTFPMALITAAPYSMTNDLGSLTCAQTLAPPYLSAPGQHCGLESGPYYGGCGHVDVDEASGYLTCGNQTNVFEGVYDTAMGTYVPSTMPVNRTMVVSLAPTIFNSPIKGFGGVQASGGAQIWQ